MTYRPAQTGGATVTNLHREGSLNIGERGGDESETLRVLDVSLRYANDGIGAPGDAWAEAGECLQKALDVARQQHARLWELRASVSLARLWRKLGDAAGARGMLEDIYGWFTEGFDTPDLQEAKELLDDLMLDAHERL